MIPYMGDKLAIRQVKKVVDVVVHEIDMTGEKIEGGINGIMEPDKGQFISHLRYHSPQILS